MPLTTQTRIGAKKLIALAANVTIVAFMLVIRAPLEAIVLAATASLGFTMVAYLVTNGVRTIVRAINSAARAAELSRLATSTTQQKRGAEVAGGVQKRAAEVADGAQTRAAEVAGKTQKRAPGVAGGAQKRAPGVAGGTRNLTPKDRAGSLRAKNDGTSRSVGTRLPTKTRDKPSEEVRRVTAAAARVWAGFAKEGLAQLNEISIDPTVAPSTRVRAFIELSRWQSVTGNLVEAHRNIALARVANPDTTGRTAREQLVLEVDALVELGERKRARKLLTTHPTFRHDDPTTLLRLANTWAGDDDGRAEFDQLGLINQVFLRGGYAPLAKHDVSQRLALPNLTTATDVRQTSGPLVSVIVPAYNAFNNVNFSLRSILSQTWQNIEVIVVDDASTDETASAVEEWCDQDNRVKFIRQPMNRGTYAARNAGLRAAHGEFITVHDADDWSHAEKIHAQVSQLMAEPSLMANLSHHVRALENLTFTAPTIRPQKSRIHPSLVSLMFRRSVFESLGEWDEVRGSGDAEFRARLIAKHGEGSVGSVAPDVPLAILLAGPSLTRAVATGMLSMHHVLGARRQYREAYSLRHRKFAEADGTTSASSATESTLYPHPRILDPNHNGAEGQHFDVVIMSNFTLPGGTTASNIQEITAQRRAGMRTGLLHHPVSRWDFRRPVNEKVHNIVDGKEARYISLGEKVSCDLLIIRFPGIAESLLDELPQVDAAQTIIAVNQTPLRGYDPPGDTVYDIGRAAENIRDRFGSTALWAPIGPLVRDALQQHHAMDLGGLQFADDDWVNIIDAGDWLREHRPSTDGPIRIGRHSRDVVDKWLEDPESLGAAYPSSEDFEVHVLGGAKTPKATLGGLPRNWRVHAFDSIPSRDFLHGIDVYVYFTATWYLEAFGRSPLEAMASGVPVIAHPSFEGLFGAGALYAQPDEVQDIAKALMASPGLYEERVQLGLEAVRERFSHEAHIRRVSLMRQRGGNAKVPGLGGNFGGAPV